MTDSTNAKLRELRERVADRVADYDRSARLPSQA